MSSEEQTERWTRRSVKAFAHDIEFINRKALALGCSAAVVVHLMCKTLRRQKYLADLGDSFDLAMANKEYSTALQSEQVAWNCTLSD